MSTQDVPRAVDCPPGRSCGLDGSYAAGCRNDPCREARRIAAARSAASLAYRRASSRAAKVLRDEHPARWEELLEAARLEVKQERLAEARVRISERGMS